MFKEQLLHMMNLQMTIKSVLAFKNTALRGCLKGILGLHTEMMTDE